SFLSGTTVYYHGATAGSFTVTNGLTDAGSGPASSAFPRSEERRAGKARSGSTASTPAGGTYVSTTFSRTAGAGSSPTELVTGTDNAGNPVATSLTFVND